MPARTVVNIAPLVYIPRPHRGLFSYIASRPLARGTAVMVPFGSRIVPGVVWENATHPPATTKLKSVLEVLSGQPLLPGLLLDYLLWESRATVTPLGMVLKAAIPSWAFRKNTPGYFFANETRERKSAVRFQFLPRTHGPPVRAYASAMAQQLRAGRQSLILAPTFAAQTALLRALPVRLGALPAPKQKTKDAREAWLRIRSGKPLAIAGSARALRLPFTNLGLVIVDDVTHPLWKETRAHPYTDARDAARTLAGIHGARLVFSGFFPPLTQKTAPAQTASPSFPRYRPRHDAALIVDLKAQPPREGFSYALVKAVREIAAKNNKARIIFFMNRRGTAPALRCGDCGFVFTCTHCDAPVTVFRKPQDKMENERRNELRCRHCGRTFIPPLVCPSCRGFRLQARGIGGEKTEETIRHFFPDVWVRRFDADTVRTRNAQEKRIEEFTSQQKPAFLVTTTKALNHALPLCDLAAVLAADQLFVAPDLAAEEEAFGTLLRLGAFVKPRGKFILQTWHPQNPVFTYALKNDVRGFTRRELALRKQFDLPPYRRLAKLTYAHRDNAKAAADAARLVEYLREKISPLLHRTSFEIVGPYPAFIPRLRGNYVWHILVKWKPKHENDLSMEDRLRDEIPAAWDIDVRPTSLV